MIAEIVIVFIAVVWIYCGYLTYGYTLAHFQREFELISEKHRVDDCRFALFVAVSGPVGLFVNWITNSMQHGRLYKWYSN